MVAKSSPDWLPPGWSVQSRDQKRGRKIEFYIHLETGKKFFSKDDAVRFIKMENTRGKKPQPTSVQIPNHSEEVPSQLEVDPTEYPEWLPNGWKVELRIRQSGVQVGREYKCYIDPSRECTFYSKPEVFRYLKTVKRKSSKSGNLKSISSKRCITEGKDVTTMQLTKNVYVEKHHVEDLPPGWIKEIKVTKYANRFRKDPYYTDPDSGYVFRSKKDVICYLETGEISKHAFKPRNMCGNVLKLANDAPSSATKRRKLEHPVMRRQVSQPKIELPDRREGNMLFVEVEGSVVDPGKMSSAGDEPGLTPAISLNKNNSLEPVMEKSNVRRALVHSSKSKNKEIHNLSRRSSKRLAGISLELPEAGSSKLLDKRVPYESGVAFSSTTEIVQEKHLTGNMLEKCAETKEDSSLNTLEKSKGRRALVDSSKSTNKEKINFSRRFSKRLAGSRLELPESESSKLQDKMVPSVSAVAFASTAEVVQEKRLVDDIVENCAKNKEDGSPRRPSQAKVELSDIHGGGKIDVRRASVDSSKSKNKEKFNLCRRFSKRLAGSRLELPETESSELPDKMVSSVSGVAFASTADVVKEKQLTNNILEKCAKTEEDGSPSSSSQPKAELCERHEGERSLLEVGGPLLDPGKMMCAGHEPLFTHAAYTLNENNSVKTVFKKSNIRRSPTGSSKSKNKEKLNLSRRSSKRLAGLEPEGAANLVSTERAVQAATRKPSKSDSGQEVGLASDLVSRASQQLGAPSETKVTHHTLTDLKSASPEQPLDKRDMQLDDQVVPKEQQQELETEKGDAEKPEPELSILFGSDPCLEFAFKTLTGELPIFDNVDNRPILRPAADMMKEENSFDGGMEKNCSRKPRANKSKDSKELKLPRWSSNQYAGVEPELLASTMSEERAIRIATENSCKSIAIPAVDLADEASQPLEITPEAKLAIRPCTAINNSMQEELSNKSVKALEEHAVPQEKPQNFETEKAHVEHPEPHFSFPFMDSWSDPCLDFAFKTLTGAIPLEDDYYHGYFQEKLDTSHNHRDSLALPDFGTPSLFQSDILPQFDPPEQSVSGQQFPMNSAFLPSGNVTMPNCSGIGSGQQLSSNPSSLPAGNVSMSNCSGVCSGQQLPMNPSSLPARNVSTSNCSGVCSGQQLSMNSSFLPAGSVSMSNCNAVCSGQQLSINSSCLPAGNVSLSNCSLVDSQWPCVGGSNDYHGNVKS
ncbi:hypothetical protein D8674_028922 [Pyrus ussuriensis x Pyrus communis]|uniref:MBD domain-containing protein n=1 Tax=Pyrus ussuriensis x Pyrus communis TaxID=2448454 RepID=A0A5N5HXN2_9ROSA|nr:hypothetical protein D8674_028922 [Pyrus ussuriensis x Pyrus communis]